MNNFIASYSIYKIFTNPVFWFFVALTFVYSQVTQKLTPPAVPPDQTICTEVSCPNPKKALSILNQAISKNPKNSTLYGDRASIYCVIRQISQCLSDHDIALKLSSDQAATYTSFGVALAVIDPNRSAKALDQSIKIYRQRGDTFNENNVRQIKSVYGF